MPNQLRTCLFCKFGDTAAGAESDKSPGGVDGELPASTWVEVFAGTWQVGLGGRGAMVSYCEQCLCCGDQRERQQQLVA